MGMLGKLFGGGLPKVRSDEAEGFSDLVFKVVQADDHADALHVVGKATDKGNEVGLEVVIPHAWTEQSFGPGIDVLQGKVQYRSLGGPSDAIVSILDELYETEATPGAMRESIEFDAMATQGDPRSPAGGPIRVKLTYAVTPDEKAVLYTDLDLDKGKLHIREHDVKYRQAVVKALAGS